MGFFLRSNYNNLKKALKMYRKQVLSLQVLLKSINKFWGKRKKTTKNKCYCLILAPPRTR